MKIITVANQKGGIGKTTTVVTVAHGLALKGLTTLIVDLDAQGHCARMLNLPREPGVAQMLTTDVDPVAFVRATGRERLYLLPGDKRTATAWAELLAQRASTLDLVAESLPEQVQPGDDGRGAARDGSTYS